MPYPSWGQADPPSEVALVDGFAPCGDHWVAHGSIIKIDELVCVFTFIHAVGLCCRFGGCWDHRVWCFPHHFVRGLAKLWGLNCTTLGGFFSIVCYLTPCLVKNTSQPASARVAADKRLLLSPDMWYACFSGWGNFGKRRVALPDMVRVSPDVCIIVFIGRVVMSVLVHQV